MAFFCSDRYAKAKDAGMLLETQGDIMHHLLERCGGHYMSVQKIAVTGSHCVLTDFLLNRDMGATSLFVERKVAVRSGVSPASYTGAGLRLSDGSTLEADAIIFATGFADKNVRNVAASILGGGDEAQRLAQNLDATWGLDAEGELRGMYKRHKSVANYWVFGGFTRCEAWHSAF